MKLFSEKVNHTFTNSSFNVLQVENFSEIFFDVYEIELNKAKYPVEKVDDYNGHPVVSVPVVIGEQEYQYPFVLMKGAFEVLFNENNKFENVVYDNVEPVQVISESEIDIVESPTSFEKETNYDNLIREDSKKKILEEIQAAKQKAAKQIDKLKKSAIADASFDIKIKKQEFDKTLQEAKDQLVNEFVSISNKIKSELLDANNSRYSEIKDSVSGKIGLLAEKLQENITNDFESASKIFDDSIKSLVMELHTTSVLPKLKEELSEIAQDVVQKVATIEDSLNSKLSKKADISLLEGVSNEINAITIANTELNNAINKGVNKALSRVGNVNNRIDEVAATLVEDVDTKIQNATDNINKYYSDKLAYLEDQAFEINEKTRKYFIDLIQESKENLINEIRNIKKESPIEYVIESNNKRNVKSFDSIASELDKKISDKISDEVIRLRKYIAVYSGGGGSVAQQFADGGVMNGNLTVVGAISASQYLGMQGGLTGDYLPLSGGTVSGDLAVSGLLSANRIAFNTDANLTAGVGQLTWNNSDGTLDLGLKGGSVTLQVGQDSVVRVVNKTSVNLLKSQYKVVRIRSTAEGGAQGQRLAIVLAQGNSDPTSVDTIGLVAEDISNNQEGFIVTNGMIHNIDTTGSLQGETWVDGDVLYVSPTTAGVLTNVEPQAPNHTIIVGFVVYAHQNQGKIFIKVDNGYELNEIHNVRIDGVSNGDLLAYDSLSGVWRNSTGNYLPLAGGTISGNLNVTGILSSSNLVYNTGSQTISGAKTFTNDVTVSGNVSANNLVYTSTLAALSTNWNNTFNTVSSLSSNWQTSYNTLSTKANLIGGNLFSGTQTLNGILSSDNSVYGTNLVYNTGDQTVAGIKTFTNNIVGNGTSNTLPNQLAASTDFTAIATQEMVAPFPTFGGPPPYYRIFEDFPASSGLGTHGWTNNGSAGSSAANTSFATSNTLLLHGAITLNTGATLNNFRSIYLSTGGASSVGNSLHTLFAVPSANNIQLDFGFTGGGSGDTVMYSTLSGGWYAAKTGNSGVFSNLLVTAALSSGDFLSGVRYKVSMSRPSATTTKVHLAYALYNSTTWNTIYNNTVSHASHIGGWNQVYPTLQVTTLSAVNNSIIIDYVGVEKLIQR